MQHIFVTWKGVNSKQAIYVSADEHVPFECYQRSCAEAPTLQFQKILLLLKGDDHFASLSRISFLSLMPSYRRSLLPSFLPSSVSFKMKQLPHLTSRRYVWAFTRPLVTGEACLAFLVNSERSRQVFLYTQQQQKIVSLLSPNFLLTAKDSSEVFHILAAATQDCSAFPPHPNYNMRWSGFSPIF